MQPPNSAPKLQKFILLFVIGKGPLEGLLMMIDEYLTWSHMARSIDVARSNPPSANEKYSRAWKNSGFCHSVMERVNMGKYPINVKPNLKWQIGYSKLYTFGAFVEISQAFTHTQPKYLKHKEGAAESIFHYFHSHLIAQLGV